MTANSHITCSWSMEPIFTSCLLMFLLKNIGGTHGDSTPFTHLYTEFWEWRKVNNPEFASNVGDHRFTDKLESYSLDAFEDRKADMDGFMSRLKAIQRDSLSFADAISYDVLEDTIQTWLDGYKWRFYGPMNVISNIDGIQTKYGSRARQVAFKTEADFWAFVKRIDGYGNQVNETIERMNKAIQQGTTNHAASMGAVGGQLDNMLAFKNNESYFPFYEPFKDKMDSLTGMGVSVSNKSEIRSAALGAVKNFLFHIQRLKDYIETTYMSSTRQAVGVDSLPNGAEYYQACLKWQLSVNLTADEIHQMGKVEVERIYEEMQKIMNKLGHDGNVKEFFDGLKSQQKYFIQDKEETLQRFRDLRQRVAPKLNQIFRDIPDLPMEVEEMSYDGPGGIYQNGAPDGSRPGVFLANVNKPSNNPTYSMPVLSFHEMDPGHHIQDGYALKSQDIPDYRKSTDFSKYNAVPLHFPFYSAYSEGWALYSEDLAQEIGLYEDDYELMGRYSMEIFRAARLVVDTGLHAKGWSKQQAVDYMLNLTSLSESRAENEINRYITWPGQAVSYKVGALKFWELRRRAEAELCGHFNLKDFHYVVLSNGAMPLNVLSEVVNEWIQSVKVNNRVCVTGGSIKVLTCETLSTVLLVLAYVMAKFWFTN